MVERRVLTVVGTLAFDTLGRVAALATPEETAALSGLDPDQPGGTAGNVAMALARLGVASRLVASVGPDFAGSSYDRALAEAGVDVSGLVRVDAPTARAYIFFDGGGAQATYFHAGASALFLVEPGRFRGTRAHFCAGEIARYPPLMEAAEWASFDPGQETFHRAFEEIEACLPHTDVLFVNRHELAVFEKHGWTTERILAAGVGALIETRGSAGTLVHTPTGRFAAPAVPARAVDPTGAGDAHRAGFLLALERGADLGVAARVANTMGAFAVEQVGAQAGQPTLDEVIERYARAYGSRPFA